MLRITVALCLVGLALAGPPVSRSRADIESFREFLESSRTGLALAEPPVSRSRADIERFREFLESSRTERGIVVGEGTPQGSAWENSGKFQGDILLDDEQIEAIIQQYSTGRNAYIWPNTLWPSRTIPYEFAAGHFDNAQREYVLYTMRVLEEHTCIRFRPRNPGEFNYALITGYSDGCYASVGYWASRGVHTMNVARDIPGRGCFNPIVIIHEWLHVIGFFHMQSTHDRDNYVRINWGNIVRGMEYNFDRYETNIVSNLGLPYEYDSCMHYGAYAFTINGRTTIDALRPHTGEMGQTSYVTGLDFWRVDRHYGCAAWRTAEEYQPFHFDGDVVPAKEEVIEEAEVKVEPVKIVDAVL